MKMLEIENMASEMNNFFDGLRDTLEKTKEKISKLEISQ